MANSFTFTLKSLANEKCPNCSEDMIVKLYKNMKVVSCLKCKYSRREKLEKNQSENDVAENVLDEIEILNKLDEQNEKS